MAAFNPTVEVCREYLDKKCKRDERYCRFAHPSQKHEILNGRIVCCVDYLKVHPFKNRCNREDPPCKYYHPPKHIRDKVLDDMKYQKLCKEFGIEDDEGNAELQQAVMNTLLPQLNILTEKILKYGKSEGYDNLDPSVADTLKSCHNLLDAMVQDNLVEIPQRNDVIEVCREFMRGDCNRPDTKCKFAHPGQGVHINSDQTVTICLNHMRGSCVLENCRYFHLPNHLKKFVRTDFPPRRKRKISNESNEEGPSSKQPLDIFKFGRTPPRDEQDATFGSPSSSKAESYAVQQADPQDQSDPPQLQNNNPMPPVHEPIV